MLDLDSVCSVRQILLLTLISRAPPRSLSSEDGDTMMNEDEEDAIEGGAAHMSTSSESTDSAT